MHVIKSQMHKAIKQINMVSTDNIGSQTTTNSPINIQTETIRRGCLYIPKTSEQISKILKSTLNNIELAFRPIRQLKNTVFSKTKQKIDVKDRTHVVYKIFCGGCDEQPCNKCYIGQTKNQSEKRKKQHISSIKNPTYDGSSSLTLHFLETGHTPDFEKMEIVDTEQNWSKRLTLESLHIAANNTYNVQREKGNTSAVYCSLVKKHAKINEKPNKRLTIPRTQ